MNRELLKLSVLVSHPIQYFVPVYRALSELADLDFFVLYRTRVGIDSYFDEGFRQEIQWDIRYWMVIAPVSFRIKRARVA